MKMKAAPIVRSISLGSLRPQASLWPKRVLIAAAVMTCANGGLAIAADTNDKLAAENPVLAESVFGLYANNREQGIPNYITVDLPLVAYSLIRKRSIEAMENKLLVPALSNLLGALELVLAEIEPNNSSTSNSQSEAELELQAQATTANQQYIALLQSLLNEKPLPSLLPETLAEYQKVIEATGVAPSGLWGRNIDYSQYQPRGRYTDDEASARYFRTMRYAGAQFFAVQPSAATGVDAKESELQVLQAVQLATLLTQNEALKTLREELDNVLSWQFGVTEDMDDKDVMAVLTAIDQPSNEQSAKDQPTEDQSINDQPSAQSNNTSPSDTSPSNTSPSDDQSAKQLVVQPVAQSAAQPTDELGKLLLSYAQEQQRQPRIIDAVVDASLLEPDVSLSDSLTGWRLLPARYSARAATQQALLSPATGDFNGDSNESPFSYGLVGGKGVKAFPVALEWPALLGSQWASMQLDSAGDQQYQGYVEAFQGAQQWAGALQGAEMVHAAVLRSGFTNAESDNMLSNQRMQTLLAYQTWQQYLELLYVKQSYTPMSKGLQLMPKKRSGAAIERAYAVYLSLGYAAREQLKHSGFAQWEAFAKLMDQLASLSLASPSHVKSSESNQAFLNSLDLELLKLTSTSDYPIVVDVHTEPSSKQVVYFATGFPTLAEHEEARGARLNFMQFKQDMSNRLTIEQWLQQLHESGAQWQSKTD